jgi:hypothetical protein
VAPTSTSTSIAAVIVFLFYFILGFNLFAHLFIYYMACLSSRACTCMVPYFPVKPVCATPGGEMTERWLG